MPFLNGLEKHKLVLEVYERQPKITAYLASKELRKVRFIGHGKDCQKVLE